MGLLKRVGRGLVRRVADRVAQNELFERPGERAPTAPLGGPEAPVPAPAPAPAVARGAPSAPPAPAACTVADLAALQAALGPGGGWRVVNHWATWCIPCVEEFPELLVLHSRLPPGVRLFGVSWDLFDPRGDEDDIVEHVENFATGHGLRWDSLLVGASVPAETFFARLPALAGGNQTVPQTWVLDPSGTLRHRHDGVLGAADIDALLAALTRAMEDQDG